MDVVVEDLYVVVNGREIISHINFSVSGPGLYFILGRNGSGKSTLLKALAGLIKFRGRVLINGRDVREYRRRDLARVVGFVWQNPMYGFFESSVEREIRFILKNLGMDNINFDRVVRYFGVEHLLKRSPFTLSGGEAKRVEMCSVIVADQEIYLLDEPEGELDYDGLERLIRFLHEESKRKLIIVATHNTLFAYKMRDIVRKYILISDGKLVGIYDKSILNDDDFLRRMGIVPLNWWLG